MHPGAIVSLHACSPPPHADFHVHKATSQAADFRTHEITIGRFLTTLLPVHQLDAALPADRRAYVVVHTVAHAAVIELHQRFARTDPTSFEKCLRAARAALALVKHVADTDFEFLDPVIGVRRPSLFPANGRG